jgi:hypothetical protein
MGEERVKEGAKHAPCGDSVLRIRVAEVLVPYLHQLGSACPEFQDPVAQA